MTVTGSILTPSMKIKTIQEDIIAETLLSETGWFYLNDVFRVLDPEETGKYKLAFKQIERMIEKGEDPYEVMGRKKFGGRVAIQMERFAPWYRANELLKVRKLEPDMSFQDFLEDRDHFFRLSEVCKYFGDFLPYTYSILKRNADRCDDPREEIGVFKYDTTYLVTTPRFEEWLRQQILN